MAGRLQPGPAGRGHLGAVLEDPTLFTPPQAGRDERAACLEMKEPAGRGREGRAAQQLASLSSPLLSFPRQSRVAMLGL